MDRAHLLVVIDFYQPKAIPPRTGRLLQPTLLHCLSAHQSCVQAPGDREVALHLNLRIGAKHD
jgi:hypothetical protein